MAAVQRSVRTVTVVLSIALGVFVLYVATGAQAQTAPRYKFDPDWPKPLPNKWKMGGVTGLAVDKDDNVWVYNRPNDTTPGEDNATPPNPTAACCIRPPSMIHIDKSGNVIGSFDAPQGHGMGVDSQGFVYLGQNTVRKYDPKTGTVVKELPRVPEAARSGPGGTINDPKLPDADKAAIAAYRTKYPPETPMIVGGIEEIRFDEPVREMYVTDSYLGGRMLVFDMDTFAFKRGWGAYGKPLAQISVDDADHVYRPNGPMPKDFAGHLTQHMSNDGMVYLADRFANRIQVTDKQGKYMNKEFIIAPSTGEGGSTGGLGFSTDRQQRYLFVSDITNNHIWFLNRADGRILGQMGSMGENGGQWFGLELIAVDSKGNIYTGEVFNGERVQRFVPN